MDDHEVQFCTHLKGKRLVVPALQQGVERRRGQSAEPQRPQDRLPVEAGSSPATGSRTSWRITRRSSSSKDEKTGKQEAKEQIWPRYHQLDVVRRAAWPTRARARSREAVSDSAFGRQRQVQLHRLAGPPADRSQERDGAERGSIRSSSSPTEASWTGRSGTRSGSSPRSGPPSAMPRTLRPPPHVAQRGQADRHLHGAEVPVHPGRDRQRAAGAALRHHHRRGAFEPGRPHLGSRSAWRSGRRAPRRKRRPPRTRSTGMMAAQEAAPERQLLRLHRHAQEQDAGDLRRGVRRGGWADQAPCPSTATP